MNVLLMVFPTLLLSSACVSAWQIDSYCGVKGPRRGNPRIVGGMQAKPHEFPWQVAMIEPGGCGASVLAKEWVVTAAHCIDAPEDPSSVKLLFGLHRVTDPYAVSIPVTAIYVHPEFDEETNENDIALLKLKSKLPFSSRIGAICLPEKEKYLDELAGESAIVTGWGKTQSYVDQTILRKVDVNIWYQAKCIKAHYPVSKITRKMICANGYKKDSCQGDSGGPLATFNYKLQKWQLTGIVSFGFNDKCATRAPGVYTRVAAFLPWIKRTIQHCKSHKSY